MKDYILELDRQRKLVYDFDAWDLITERYAQKGKGKEDFDPTQIKATYAEIPFLTYAGLRWEDSALNEAAVKKLLNDKLRSGNYTIMDIMEIVINAIFAQSGLKEVPIKEAVEKAAADAQKKILESSSIGLGSKTKEKPPSA